MTTSVAAQSALRRALIAAAAVVLGATGLLLAAPATASADAVFLITGTVTGTAVGATDAAALEGVTVRSFDADGVAGPTAVTDVAGLYTLAVPAAGDYSLEFNNCAASPACLPDYSSDWYGRNGLLSLAETFPLTEAAPIRVADFQLSAASTVSGQITDGSGQALGGAKVGLARPDAPNGLDATTAADGSYSFSQVPADTFDLTASYRDPDQSFQNVKYYADGAQQLTVAAGSTNGGADAALEYLPSIKGRVVDGSGNPLPHVAWS
ncbi:MAG: hypothetical protein JWR53_1240, partial [Glaciihabitans sp.]|nr:hypothetical protein [Glaciihabitans sp.]